VKELYNVRKFLVQGKQIAMKKENGFVYYIDEFDNYHMVNSLNLVQYYPHGKNIISINAGEFETSLIGLVPVEIILFTDLDYPDIVYNELKSIFWIQ